MTAKEAVAGLSDAQCRELLAKIVESVVAGIEQESAEDIGMFVQDDLKDAGIDVDAVEKEEEEDDGS